MLLAVRCFQCRVGSPRIRKAEHRRSDTLASPTTSRRKKPDLRLPGQMAMPPETGTFSAGNVIMTPDSPGWGGLLAADVAISWSQRIMRVYEVGTSTCYLTVGRATGNWQASQIVAPAAVSFRF